MANARLKRDYGRANVGAEDNLEEWQELLAKSNAGEGKRAVRKV